MLATINILCYKSKTLANGEHPLMIRVTKDGKKKYLSLGISVLPQFWDFEKNKPRRHCPNKVEIEKIIAEKSKQYADQIIELKTDNKPFTATTLIESVDKKVKGRTVGDLFLSQINLLKKQKRTGYALSHLEVYNSLIKFNGHLDIYFMGGINFVDMAYMTIANIIDERLVYTRKKTGKLIRLPLQTNALAIINKYLDSKNKYIFPILSEKHKTEQSQQNRVHKVITKVNKHLKDIGEELELPIKLTTYVARHSFATVLKRSGVSTSIISESLGHSSEKITQIYLDSFENSQIDEAMKNLL
ncbi:tyrosine-type recombinase/integrase [Odoribacter sp. OttesenSCG-928-L07]|nr:tyrosine-type recombinase/integrase [Odoribacter sp. OttesenSCG-928-L07]MDL2239093.1 tyrosine-type recombinase/integrase [Bacteroidales bacterium OttesenSCG-928-L14]MDL2240006.1 tyrosine-type recombinase/integrase [Bacteroidales bacterium OttesenSCG-928-K22]